MSQHVRRAPLALSSGLIVTLAIACGHSARFDDAFEKSKGQPVTGTGGTGNTGNGGSSGNGGSGGGTAAVSGGGTGPATACGDAPTQQFDPTSMQAYVPTQAILKETDDIIGKMNLDEKISQMLGVDLTVPADYQDIERSPDVTLQDGTRIRGYNYRDAGHGVNLDAGQYKSAGDGARATDGHDYSTVFPAESARAASWDVELEHRVGQALGDETAGSKNNMLLAPCMNIIRHPYWGRTQETYSEDSYHIGRMAAAFTVGLQEYVVGCAKHFAANNIEKFRSSQDAVIDSEQTLREIYGRHFEMVIRDGGIGCIMASYNMINGVKSTQNPKLLTNILRLPPEQGGMGYRGLVISDWWAMPGDQNVPTAGNALNDASVAANAGLDIEVPWTLHYSTAVLNDAVKQNFVEGKVIEDHARHVIEQKVRFNSAYYESPWGLKTPESTLSGASIATNEKHEALAEEVELKSAVLLKNGDTTPVLPITTATPKVAVVGITQYYNLINSTLPKSGYPFNFAVDAALGDRGSSRVNGDPARVIGPTAGLTAAAPMGVTVTSYSNTSDASMMPGNGVAAAGELAPMVQSAQPDLIVVVVGYTPGDEGEEYAIPAGGDRHTLNLPPGHNELVNMMLDLGKPTVIIIESGSVVAVPWLQHTNTKQATVWAGYPGVRGGPALGRLLFAKDGANFSGKMPLAWPQDDAQIPNVFKESGEETGGPTRMGYFFGYRAYDDLKAKGTPKVLSFPFGHGISYSTFSYGNLMIPCTTEAASKNAVVKVTVEVTNTAGPAGDEIAMLFVKPPTPPDGTKGQRPQKELKSFARVSLMPAEKKVVELPVRIQDLRRWEGGEDGHWVIDRGDYTIMVGPSGDDAELTQMGMLNVAGG